MLLSKLSTCAEKRCRNCAFKGPAYVTHAALSAGKHFCVSMCTSREEKKSAAGTARSRALRT